MHTFRIQTRRGALCSLIAAATTSVAVLGATVALFGEAGRTPAFEPGSALAEQATRCPYPLSQAARHGCLRQIAAAAAQPGRHDTLLLTRAASESALH